MELRQRNAEEVVTSTLSTLGLPATVQLSSPEAVGALVRRSASFLCPCPPLSLIEAVSAALVGLVDSDFDLSAAAREALEGLTALGDLVERRVDFETGFGSTRRLIYLGPPAFVKRASGSLVVIGTVPDSVAPLPDEATAEMTFAGYLRRLDDPTGNVAKVLQGLGYLEIADRLWLSIPRRQTASEHVAALNVDLDAQQPSGHVSGLRILDSDRPVRYYPGRWKAPSKETGRFVARRPQAYGADLWCFVHLEGGEAVRVMDFPPLGSPWRGCDHAWRLQAAIDRTRGKPQELRVRNHGSGQLGIDIYSPIPAWVQRRWSLIGQPVAPESCLLSFAFAADDCDEELSFSRQDLWLEPNDSELGPS